MGVCRQPKGSKQVRTRILPYDDYDDENWDVDFPGVWSGFIIFEEMDKKPGDLFFYFQVIDLIRNSLSLLVTYPKILEIPVFRRVYDHWTSIGGPERPGFHHKLDRHKVMPFRVSGRAAKLEWPKLRSACLPNAIWRLFCPLTSFATQLQKNYNKQHLKFRHPLTHSYEVSITEACVQSHRTTTCTRLPILCLNCYLLC